MPNHRRADWCDSKPCSVCSKPVYRTGRGMNAISKTCSWECRSVAIGRAIRTHGESRTPLYYTWAHMISRCENKNSKDYPDYGGRGITVCERWRDSFPAFKEDMGARPDGATINRIDNDGNYEPENCCWAFDKEQARNRRGNRLVTYQGETLSVAEWAEKLGLVRTTLVRRLNDGWTIERAFHEAPYRGKNQTSTP